MRSLRGKNCLSLGLSTLASCDACKKFKLRLDGLGRKPGKNAKPRCEQLWDQEDATFMGRRLVQDRARKELETLGYSVRKGKPQEKTSRRFFLSSHGAYKIIQRCPNNNEQPKMLNICSLESQ